MNLGILLNLLSLIILVPSNRAFLNDLIKLRSKAYVTFEMISLPSISLTRPKWLKGADPLIPFVVHALLLGDRLHATTLIPLPFIWWFAVSDLCRFGGVENGQSFHAEHWHETRDARVYSCLLLCFPDLSYPHLASLALVRSQRGEVLPSNKSQRGSALCCIMQPYASINLKQNNNMHWQSLT